MMQDNPEPKKNNFPAVWALVIQDMQERDDLGVKRYGMHLQPFNGRDALLDAYQECLDMAVYLKQAMIERKEENQMCNCESNETVDLEEYKKIVTEVQSGILNREYQLLKYAPAIIAEMDRMTAELIKWSEQGIVDGMKIEELTVRSIEENNGTYTLRGEREKRSCNCQEDAEIDFTSSVEFRLQRIEQMIRPVWKSPQVYPMPLNQPVLVYLKNGERAIATRLANCTVIGSNVPIEDVIRLWIELPELPVGFTNLLE